MCLKAENNLLGVADGQVQSYYLCTSENKDFFGHHLSVHCITTCLLTDHNFICWKCYIYYILEESKLLV